MTLPELSSALPVHNLDALRAEVTALLACKVKPTEISAMLFKQGAPVSAVLEAMIVMGQPSSPMRIAKALSLAATRTDLHRGLSLACRRWGIHPASLVALETGRPLALGTAMGLPEALVRSFPGKRRAAVNQGLWAPPTDFLDQSFPEDLVLNDLQLCKQPRLLHLPQRFSVARKLVLDRLENLTSLGPSMETFRGQLTIRDCPRLAGLPVLNQATGLVVDAQPWTQFPEVPIEASRISLHRMRSLERLEPCLTTKKLTLSLCPRLQELPHLPHLLEAPPDPEPAARRSPGFETWMPDVSCGQHGLTVSGCHALRDLPGGFRLSGTLTLQDCWGFDTLPSDLEVRHLVLRRLPALRQLPAGLHVRGHLILEGLANLEALPEGLQVDGDLAVHLMPQELVLPKHLTVRGKIRIHPIEARLPWPDRPRVLPSLALLDYL